MGIFATRESAVRSYCRAWPTVFDRAVGSWLYDTGGRAYLDFFAGAGALNYGHNNPALKAALLEYLAGDRVIHSLDMYTVAKRDFLTAFDEAKAAIAERETAEKLTPSEPQIFVGRAIRRKLDALEATLPAR